MKRLLLTALLIGFTTFSFCQNAYYDALKLKTAVNAGQFDASTTNVKLITDILSQYVKLPSGSPVTFANIKTAIGTSLNPKNPFLAPYMQSAGDGSITASSISNSISTIGETPVTSLADGAAKFLVKRAKQELLISFFRKFPELEIKYPEMRILFPNTCDLVNNFNSWEYANIINTLKEALEKDLKELLVNIPKINDIDPTSTTTCSCTTDATTRIKGYQTFLKSEKGIAIIASMVIGNQFLSGNKLPDIINNVTSAENLSKIQLTDHAKEQNIKSALLLIKIMSNALRNTDITKNYVSIAEIDALLGNTDSRNIFLGLLYQQLKNENVTFNGLTVSDYFQIVNSNGLSTYIRNFVDNSIQVSNAIKKLKADKVKSNKNLGDDWVAIFQSMNDLIPVITNLNSIDSRITLPGGIQNIVEKSQKATTIAQDIAIKNYSAAVVGILSLLHDDSNNQEFKEFKTLFIKYGSFAANVAQAKDSNEVEQAIESVALPVGSSSIKRETNFNVSLNAYLGAFAGKEYMRALPANNTAFTTGITAPIGVAISWGNLPRQHAINTGGKSLTLFFPLVDIGALAAFRLKDDQTNISSNIELKNIISPGLYLYFGFGKTPISLGLGAQIGPQLRDIKDGTNITVTDKIYVRYGFTFVVDIPLLNLYTKSK